MQPITCLHFSQKYVKRAPCEGVLVVQQY